MKLTNYMRQAFVRAAMADVPNVDYDEKVRDAVMRDAIEQLPPKVRAIYKDAATRGYVNLGYYGSRWNNICAPCVVGDGFKPTQSAINELDTLQAAGDTQKETRRELEAKLKAVAQSATTRAKLAEMLPEFEKYLPANEVAAIRTVPAIANVVADFTKAGWPASKKKS